jgi:hypothetical protein
MSDRFTFTVTEEFANLVPWLQSLPMGARSAVIREALASYHDGQAEVVDVLTAVRDVEDRVALLETRLGMISQKLENVLLLLQQGVRIQRPSGAESAPTSEREPERARRSLNAMRNKFTGGGRG